MADNTVQGGTDTIATDELATLNGGAVSGFKAQRVKVGFGVDSVLQDVTAAAPLPVVQSGGTATLANVTAAVATTVLRAANTARRGLLIFNDSTSVLYVNFGSAASSTAFTVKLAGGAYYEMPPTVYTGAINGIWVTANGAARVTEIT